MKEHFLSTLMNSKGPWIDGLGVMLGYLEQGQSILSKSHIIDCLSPGWLGGAGHSPVLTD